MQGPLTIMLLLATLALAGLWRRAYAGQGDADQGVTRAWKIGLNIALVALVIWAVAMMIWGVSTVFL